jgi:glucan phosphorylase
MRREARRPPRRRRCAARLKVGFLPEYDVSLLQRLLPGSDISSQSCYEASGTSDMKFMMNGALNRDPRRANIEIGQEAGDENFFLFDLTPNRWPTAGRGAAPTGARTTNGTRERRSS